MAHAHSIYDTDKRFSIDPATREIVNESGKTVLSQRDHNSERFTFSVPKEVDGHDMSLCNRVQIHYLNIEAGKDALTYEGLYEVEDLQLNSEDSETVICSWLISGNATQYVGNLLFAIHFACVADDGAVDYSWGTGIHSSVSIGKTIYNSEVIALEYADVLEKWRVETFAMVDETLKEFSETGLGDNAVTTPKIAPKAVDRSKLAEDALYSPIQDWITSRTLTVADIGKTMKGNWNELVTLTLTQANSTQMPVGAEIAVFNYSQDAGQGTKIVGDGVRFFMSGDNANYTSATIKITDPFGMIALKKFSTNSNLGDGWLVTGNVEVV